MSGAFCRISVACVIGAETHHAADITAITTRTIVFRCMFTICVFLEGDCHMICS